MATYTIKINENTSAGKSLIAYLYSLDVIVETNGRSKSAYQKTLDAMKEIEDGKGIVCDSFDDYLKEISK